MKQKHRDEQWPSGRRNAARGPVVVAQVVSEEQMDEQEKMNRRQMFQGAGLILATLVIPAASNVVQRINGTMAIPAAPSLWQRFIWWLQTVAQRPPPPVNVPAQPSTPPLGVYTFPPTEPGGWGVVIKRHKDNDPCGEFGTIDPLVQTWGAARRLHPEYAEQLEYAMARAVALKHQARRGSVIVPRLTEDKGC